MMKAPVEVEMRKSKDGLGFNIKGGRDRKFVEEDNGIFVSTIVLVVFSFSRSDGGGGSESDTDILWSLMIGISTVFAPTIP